MSESEEDFFDAVFGPQQVMAIMRGYPPEETVARVEQAWDLGVEVVEVPVETPAAMPSLLASLRSARDRGKLLGAGTICSVEQLDAVVEAGVAFTVAPGLDIAVLERSRELDIPHLPGIATASEIERAIHHGQRWVKAFPASVLGVGWFRAMRGPFPELKIVATGGMDVDNAPAFLSAGVDVVALGSSLAQIDQWERISELLDGKR